jgi:hypothetical protein
MGGGWARSVGVVLVVGAGALLSAASLLPLVETDAWWVRVLDFPWTQEAFGLVGYELLPNFGSDHLPVLAELCHAPSLADLQEAPPLAEGDLAETAQTLDDGLRPEARRRLFGALTSSR